MNLDSKNSYLQGFLQAIGASKNITPVDEDQENQKQEYFEQLVQQQQQYSLTHAGPSLPYGSSLGTSISHSSTGPYQNPIITPTNGNLQSLTGGSYATGQHISYQQMLNNLQENSEEEKDPNFLEEGFNPLTELIYRRLDDEVDKVEDGVLVKGAANNLRRQMILSFAKIMSELYQGTFNEPSEVENEPDENGADEEAGNRGPILP